jgi:Domain of unknown function (DUF4390)
MKMNFKRKSIRYLGKVFCGCLFMIFILTMIATGTDRTPRMVDMLITSGTDTVLFYARLVDCFKTDIEKAIMAGVPATYTLHLDVYQERSYLWDRQIVQKEIQRTIKYDNLKKVFSITTNGAPQPVILQDYASAQKTMEDLNGIAAIPISYLSKGNSYYLQARVNIDKVRLPFSMEYVLFFVSFWDVETPLYKIRFSY